MIFAPVSYLAILFYFKIISILFFLLCLYLFYVFVRRRFSEKYRKKSTLHKKRIVVLIIFAILLGLLVIIGYEIFIKDTKEELDFLKKNHYEKHNPILSKEFVSKYITFPAGTQLYNFDEMSLSFISAEFSEPYMYQGVLINWVQNPDEKGAKIKLAEDTKIGPFVCKKNIEFEYIFSPHTSVSSCTLIEKFKLDGIEWNHRSIASNSRVSLMDKKPYIYIIGDATFVLNKKKYTQKIEYIKYINSNQKAYFLSNKTIYRDVNFTHPDAWKAISKMNAKGKYTIQFNIMLKNQYYEIVSLTSGKQHRGKSDEHGNTISIETNTSEVFEVFFRWINAKRKSHN